MERHLYIHGKKYRRKGDLYLLFAMLFTVIGILTFLTIIIPQEELATDLPHTLSQIPSQTLKNVPTK